MARHRKARATRTVLSWGAARVERATWRGPVEVPCVNGFDEHGRPLLSMATRTPGGWRYRPLTWEEGARVRVEVEGAPVEGERMREIEAS